MSPCTYLIVTSSVPIRHSGRYPIPFLHFRTQEGQIIVLYERPANNNINAMPGINPLPSLPCGFPHVKRRLIKISVSPYLRPPTTERLC
jgi:hypothetical protein